MQVDSTREMIRARMTGVTAALGIAAVALLTVAVVTLSVGLGEDRALINNPTVAQDTLQFDQVRFIEENLWQIPYTVPRVHSYEEIAFMEANTFQIPYAERVLSTEEIRFIEENTLGYHQPLVVMQIHNNGEMR